MDANPDWYMAILVALLMLALGSFACFFGIRFLAITIVLVGIFIGGYLGLEYVRFELAYQSLLDVPEQAENDEDVRVQAVVTIILGGAIGGMFIWPLFHYATTLLGGGIGFFGTIALLQAINFPNLDIGFLLAVGCGALAAWLASNVQVLFMMVATSLMGALCIVIGLQVLLGQTIRLSPIAIVLWLVLGGLGIFYQYNSSVEEEVLENAP